MPGVSDTRAHALRVWLKELLIRTRTRRRPRRREGMNADAGNGTGQHASTEQDAVSEPRQPPRNRT